MRRRNGPSADYNTSGSQCRAEHATECRDKDSVRDDAPRIARKKEHDAQIDEQKSRTYTYGNGSSYVQEAPPKASSIVHQGLAFESMPQNRSEEVRHGLE